MAVGGVNPYGRDQPLPTVNFGLRLWSRLRRFAPFPPETNRRVRGPARECAQRLPKRPLLHLHPKDGSEIPQFVFLEADLRRHLLSFQSRAAGIFPQGDFLCSHLGTKARPGFACHSFRKLSQPATPCAVLNHFEICKLSLRANCEAHPAPSLIFLLTSNYLVIYLSSYISVQSVLTLLVTDRRLDPGLNLFLMISLRTLVSADSVLRSSAPLESISYALFCVFFALFCARQKGNSLVFHLWRTLCQKTGAEVGHSLTTHLRGRLRFRFLKKDYPVVGAPAVARAPARQDRFRESGIAVLTTSLGRHPWPGLEQKNATPSSYYVNPQVL